MPRFKSLLLCAGLLGSLLTFAHTGTARAEAPNAAISAGARALPAEQRVALVIGNANYQTAPQLTNPNNDARSVAQLLNTAGFEVTAANDLMDCIDMDRLAAGEPAPPIELPLLDALEWPIDHVSCRGASGIPPEDLTAEEDDTLESWADKHPEVFAGGYDLRGDHLPYLRSIRTYLRSQGRLR